MKTTAEYIETVLRSADPVICPICDSTGTVETRHPELDDVLLAEVWLTGFCVCAAGRDLQDRYESDGAEHDC